MRTFIAVALSATLLASSAFAADSMGPLAPGKPAGIKDAQLSQTAWIALGIVGVAAIAVGVASGSNGKPVGDSPQLAVTATTT